MPRPSVSPSAAPLEQSLPKFAGCSGSPAIVAPPAPSGVASMPQPTPQYGQVVRTLGIGAWTFMRRASPRVGVEVAAVAGSRHEARADREFAEPLARLALLRISREQRIERRDDSVVLEVFGVKLGEPRAVERRAEIEVVAAGPFADQADLGDIRPRAAVRAAGHADDDVVVGEAVRREPLVERVDQFGQIAFALGEREPAGRQRDAGHRIAPQAGDRRHQTVSRRRCASIAARSSGETLAMMTFWLAVSRMSPLCISAIWRRPVSMRGAAGDVLDAAVLRRTA